MTERMAGNDRRRPKRTRTKLAGIAAGLAVAGSGAGAAYCYPEFTAEAIRHEVKAPTPMEARLSGALNSVSPGKRFTVRCANPKKHEGVKGDVHGRSWPGTPLLDGTWLIKIHTELCQDLGEFVIDKTAFVTAGLTTDIGVGRAAVGLITLAHEKAHNDHPFERNERLIECYGWRGMVPVATALGASRSLGEQAQRYFAFNRRETHYGLPVDCVPDEYTRQGNYEQVYTPALASN